MVRGSSSFQARRVTLTRLRSSYVRATLRDMTKRKAQIGRDGELVRTSVLVTKDTHAALLALAEEGRRPLSWEIREALEAHVAASRSGRVAA